MAKMKSTLRTLLAVSFALWGFAVNATITRVQDLEALTRDSDVVVRGTVQSVESNWVGDGPQKSIVTRVRVQVAEKLKGETGSVAEIVQPGGVIRDSDIGQIVHGMAEFQAGEEVVVFLKKHAPSATTFAVTGMAQGKYTVERSSDGKDAFAVPSVIDAALVDGDGLPVTSNAKPLELRELRQRVRAAKTQ